MNQESKSKKGKEALKSIMAPESPPSIPPILPSASSESPTAPRCRNPRLDHWSVLLAEADPGTSGPDFKYRLRGEIYGHPNPRFPDGEIALSSSLISLDVTARIAKTKNTVYELGDPDPTFVEYVERLHRKLEDYSFTFDPNARKVPRRL